MNRAQIVLKGRWASLQPRHEPSVLVRSADAILRRIVCSRFYSASNFSSPELKPAFHSEAVHLQIPISDSKRGTAASPTPIGSSKENPSNFTAGAQLVKIRAGQKLSALEDRLRKSAAVPNLKDTVDTLRDIIYGHSKQPGPEHYKQLVLANRDPFGSALHLRQIWDEIWAENISIGTDVYYAFLKALAVHPDQLLRKSVLERMEKRWITLSPDAWNDVIACLLRENELVLAVNNIQEMWAQQLTVHRWILVALIHRLTAASEHFEAYRILQELSNIGDGTIPSNTWYQLLTSASPSKDIEVTKLIWKRMVLPGYLQPATGICHNALLSAARAGDMQLASDVFQTLANRNDTASLDVCEPFLETFLAANDVSAVINFLIAIQENGLVLHPGTVRPVVEHWVRMTAFPDLDPLETLRKIIRDDPQRRVLVPVELMNALIEVRCLTQDPKSAVDIFDNWASVCGTSPNGRTYHHLFLACQALRDIELACRYFEQAVPLLKIQQRPEAFHTIIALCLDLQDYGQATQFLVAAQEFGAELTSEFIYQCLDVLASDNTDTPDQGSFRNKLEHILQGLETRKEVQELTRSSDKTTQYLLQKRAKEAYIKRKEDLRRANIGYEIRQWRNMTEAERRNFNMAKNSKRVSKAGPTPAIPSTQRDVMENDVEDMLQSAHLNANSTQRSTRVENKTLRLPAWKPFASGADGSQWSSPSRQPVQKAALSEDTRPSTTSTGVGGLDDLMRAAERRGQRAASKKKKHGRK